MLGTRSVEQATMEIVQQVEIYRLLVKKEVYWVGLATTRLRSSSRKRRSREQEGRVSVLGGLLD